jgi:hypothetical protein
MTGYDGAIIQRAKRALLAEEASEGITVDSVEDAALYLALRGWTRSMLLHSMS